MPIETYLQIISIFIAIIAVVMPIGIAAVAWMYIRQLTTKTNVLSEQIDDIDGEINLLWEKTEELEHPPG